MVEVRKMLVKCDKYLLFTDVDAPGMDDADIVRVVLPPQEAPRSSSKWLFHRNMVAHLPMWDYMFQTGIAEKFDWTANVELDHFTSPLRLKLTIARYMIIIRNG